jgi:integrase
LHTGFPAEQGGKTQGETMARIVHDAALESRTARSRLKPQGQPYYRGLEPGLLHLGYRKPLTGAGKWLARVYTGNSTYRLHRIGVADDYSDADGAIILNFKQAQLAARKLLVEQAGGAGTVGDAMDRYFRFLEEDGRTQDAIQRARYTDRAFIRPQLGHAELAKLTSEQLSRWVHDLAKRPARVRTKTGSPQRYRRAGNAPDAARARRASVKRIWGVLRAALQHAFEDGKVGSDRAWRRVRAFRGVDVARARYLTVAEAKRLINAADPDFRPLLQAALLIGARFGQIVQLRVSDFNPDVGTLRLRSRKGRGSERMHFAHLSDEAQAFFTRACAGRSGDDLVFTHDDGRPWGRTHQQGPMLTASKRAHISPPVNFHTARHTFASHSVMNGAPLLVVAKTLGHSDTRLVERVYGHLAPSYIADAIRAAAPRYGITSENVRPLHDKAQRR